MKGVNYDCKKKNYIIYFLQSLRNLLQIFKIVILIVFQKS